VEQLLAATVVGTAPLTVRIDGAASANPARRLSSYTPAAGDRVLAARYGTALYVLGKIV
jgi:hypothetical protein